MAIPFLTGQRLTADLLNANLIDYQPAVFTKTALTNRVNATLADDPDLSNIPLSVGTWEIEVLLHWTMTTTNTQKIKTRWGFTGTWATTFRDCIGAGTTQSTAASPINLTDSFISAATTDSQDAVYHQAAGGTYGTIREISRTVVVSVAGNFSVQWAQNTTTANNTTVQPGSNVYIRKIS
jgi:hypothetical protein